MSLRMLNSPVKRGNSRQISIGRRIRNKIATTLFLLSFLVALVPLVWLLWVVVERGWYAIIQPGWWSHSLRGVLP